MQKFLFSMITGIALFHGNATEARALTDVEWNYCEFISKLGGDLMNLRYDGRLKRIEEMDFSSGDAMLDKWQRIIVADIWARNPDHYRPDTRETLIPIVVNGWRLRCVNDIAER